MKNMLTNILLLNPNRFAKVKIGIIGMSSAGKSCYIGSLFLGRGNDSLEGNAVWINNIEDPSIKKIAEWDRDDPGYNPKKKEKSIGYSSLQKLNQAKHGKQWLNEIEQNFNTNSLPDQNRFHGDIDSNKDNDTENILISLHEVTSNILNAYVEIIDYPGEIFERDSEKGAELVRDALKETDGLIILANYYHDFDQGHDSGLRELEKAISNLTSSMPEKERINKPIALCINMWDQSPDVDFFSPDNEYNKVRDYFYSNKKTSRIKDIYNNLYNKTLRTLAKPASSGIHVFPTQSDEEKKQNNEKDSQSGSKTGIKVFPVSALGQTNNGIPEHLPPHTRINVIEPIVWIIEQKHNNAIHEIENRLKHNKPLNPLQLFDFFRKNKQIKKIVKNTSGNDEALSKAQNIYMKFIGATTTQGMVAAIILFAIPPIATTTTDIFRFKDGEKIGIIAVPDSDINKHKSFLQEYIKPQPYLRSLSHRIYTVEYARKKINDSDHALVINSDLFKIDTYMSKARAWLKDVESEIDKLNINKGNEEEIVLTSIPTAYSRKIEQATEINNEVITKKFSFLESLNKDVEVIEQKIKLGLQRGNIYQFDIDANKYIINSRITFKTLDNNISNGEPIGDILSMLGTPPVFPSDIYPVIQLEERYQSVIKLRDEIVNIRTKEVEKKTNDSIVAIALKEVNIYKNKSLNAIEQAKGRIPKGIEIKSIWDNLPSKPTYPSNINEAITNPGNIEKLKEVHDWINRQFIKIEIPKLNTIDVINRKLAEINITISDSKLVCQNPKSNSGELKKAVAEIVATIIPSKKNPYLSVDDKKLIDNVQKNKLSTEGKCKSRTFPTFVSELINEADRLFNGGNIIKSVDMIYKISSDDPKWKDYANKEKEKWIDTFQAQIDRPIKDRVQRYLDNYQPNYDEAFRFLNVLENSKNFVDALGNHAEKIRKKINDQRDYINQHKDKTTWTKFKKHWDKWKIGTDSSLASTALANYKALSTQYMNDDAQSASTFFDKRTIQVQISVSEVMIEKEDSTCKGLYTVTGTVNNWNFSKKLPRGTNFPNIIKTMDIPMTGSIHLRSSINNKNRGGMWPITWPCGSTGTNKTITIKKLLANSITLKLSDRAVSASITFQTRLLENKPHMNEWSE